MLWYHRNRAESEPTYRTIRDGYWGYRNVADYGAIHLCDERASEFPGFAQRVDDVLFGVARIRRIQECGDRYGLDRR